MATTVSDRKTALEFLWGRINYERTTQVPYRTSAFKLDRMRRLLSHLGDPQRAIRAVHLSGTKGKGSTATMIAESLMAAGYRTALYTSPHLQVLEERLVIDGVACQEQDFVALTAELEQILAEHPTEFSPVSGAVGEPTFFEITTAMAFLHFARRKVDFAVLEVGLGGRLDSTNVCLPEVCAITSISYDHTKQLGDTLAQIAGEKAGIIKPGVPVISGVSEAAPREVIEQVAWQCGAPLHQLGRDFHCTPRVAAGDRAACGTFSPAAQRIDYREDSAAGDWRLPDLGVGMVGAHQAANAALAIATLRRLVERGWLVPEAAIRQGLAGAHCAARIEAVAQSPTIILDAAHNGASIAALLETLAACFPARRKLLIFASSRDKDTQTMLRQLLPAFDHIFLTKYTDNPRAVEIDELYASAQAAAAEQGPANRGRAAVIECYPTSHQALAAARRAADAQDLICITGSFFLAAELRPHLVGSPSQETLACSQELGA